ncbi:hypothetical protein QMZ92_29825 [Streptomyces sp. HNM0645]|uniref:hypothetical protein n=1 Tax=Streptomyces sp. HNM0645 TaxID=2782343 RepID=UPI0024B851AD|nr:hypothetical protein [Streptomyces sp. HNM0645]MDI9888457.1 hypothetical protein [Streptomyces sp. HNM0645]
MSTERVHACPPVVPRAVLPGAAGGRSWPRRTAQMQIDTRSNEIPAFAPLLDGVDLSQAVITADAPHAQHDHASYLHERCA